jgi:hypothetical protein
MGGTMYLVTTLNKYVLGSEMIERKRKNITKTWYKYFIADSRVV